MALTFAGGNKAEDIIVIMNLYSNLFVFLFFFFKPFL